MKNKVLNTIKKYKMLDKDDKILVALSGGADSVALLLVLNELGYDIVAGHINHQLRGAESDRDEDFCKNICQSLNIKFYIEKVDVITYSKENKCSTELAARILRYNALQNMEKGRYLATAHTLSDCLETTLFNLSRGTALHGLCGIAPVRDNIIRPLIECSREEIEQYLSEKGYDFVTDSTNLSNDYTRNKIRHLVVPEIRKINENLNENYRRMAESLREDDDCISALSNELIDRAYIEKNIYKTEPFVNSHIAIAKRSIAKILKSANLECSNDKINAIYKICLNEGKINISGNVYIVASKGTISIAENLPCEKQMIELQFSEGIINFDNKQFNIKIIDKLVCNDNININNLFTNRFIDYDKIQGKAVIRNRRDGDRIHFSNRNHTTILKKLFNEKVPLAQRDKIMLLSDDAGVIYVQGFGVSKRVCADDNSTRILLIEPYGGNEQSG